MKLEEKDYTWLAGVLIVAIFIWSALITWICF